MDVSYDETSQLLSIDQVSKEQLLRLFEQVDRVRAGEVPRESQRGKIMANLFFGSSTRTRLSFESAMLRLGGALIPVDDIHATRSGSDWGEPMAGLARVVSHCADIAVLRVPEVEALGEFAAHFAKPLINAGNGFGDGSEHPTQALIDLYTIYTLHGEVDPERVLVVSPFLHRALRSFLSGLAKFGSREVSVVCTDVAWPSDAYVAGLADKGLSLRRAGSIAEAIGEADVLYQCPPTADNSAADAGIYYLDANALRGARSDLIVLHPFPRSQELDPSVDQTPHAAYFQQMSFGVPVRIALVDAMLTGTLELPNA